MTDTPKTLPWIAGKAGIAFDRIEAIWREAVRHATLHTGAAGTPDYYREAMRRLFQLVEQEKRAAHHRGGPAKAAAGTGCRATGVPASARTPRHPATGYA